MKTTIAALIASFMFGFYVNGLRWQTKLNDYQLEASSHYSDILKQEVKKKDATISLLLSEGQKFKTNASALSVTVGKLQQSIRDSNSKLESESSESNKRLIECQNLLSESTELLREGSELSTSLALKINSK